VTPCLQPKTYSNFIFSTYTSSILLDLSKNARHPEQFLHNMELSSLTNPIFWHTHFIFSEKSGLSTHPLHLIFILLIVLPSYPISIVTKLSKTAWHPENLFVHLELLPLPDPIFWHSHLIFSEKSEVMTKSPRPSAPHIHYIDCFA